MKNYKFTIFTPCYNGANTLHRVFDSIKYQTYDNWEWIIVNDGSTDSSHEIITRLIKTMPIELQKKVKYIKQNNIGKHITWNKVIKIATGDFFLPADCDDSFLPETLAFFNKAANEERELKSLSGYNVCCYDPNTSKIIGTPFPKDGMLTNNIELQYKYRIKGEHWGCQRLDLLKQYKFPEYKGHFYPENYIWFSFAKDGYYARCFNKALRAYYYEPTSLCNNKVYKFNRNKSIVDLHYSWWVCKNISSIVIKYSLISYIYLYVNLIKAVIKLLLSK